MNRREFLLASASCSLSACGGGGVGTKAISAAPSWSDPVMPGDLKDHRSAIYQGGTPGWVSACRWVTTEVGANVTGYEWNFVAVMANGAQSGENCAAYFQANARSTGNTWAAVSEVCDETYGTKQQTLVAHEFDVWCAGNDHMGRVGAHVGVGDSRAMRGVGQPGVAIGTDAIRISSNHPGARWRVGVNFDTTPDHLLAMQEGALIREPLGQYIGKLPIKVGQRTVFIPVYE